MKNLLIAQKIKEYKQAIEYYEKLLKKTTSNDDLDIEQIECLYKELVSEYKDFLVDSLLPKGIGSLELLMRVKERHE